MPTPFHPAAVSLLLDWYRASHRDLPWRNTRDPYRILVSEIMLQQTRAETVKPYYRRFLSALPTVFDLATADEATLHKLWEGLGYYSRVRNLKRAAERVVADYGGTVPADFDALLSLPGVGRYTAGAVASIAFDIPVPAVDGNVLRVIARLTGDDTDVLSPAAKANAEAALAPHIPTPGAGDFTQSLIELGALVCTPGDRPRCDDCPLFLLCVAAREGRQGELPVRIPKTRRRVEEKTVLIVRDPLGRVAIRRRADEGLLAGLYEFPCLVGATDGEEAVRDFLIGLGFSVRAVADAGMAKHLFTHIEWRMRGWCAEVEDVSPAAVAAATDWLFVTPEELDAVYAVPSAYRAYRPYCYV